MEVGERERRRGERGREGGTGGEREREREREEHGNEIDHFKHTYMYISLSIITFLLYKVLRFEQCYEGRVWCTV